MPIQITQEVITELENKIAGLIRFMSDSVYDPEPYYLHIEEGYKDTFRPSCYSKEKHDILDSDIPLIDLLDFNNFLMDPRQSDYVPDTDAIHDAVISFLEYYETSNS